MYVSILLIFDSHEFKISLNKFTAFWSINLSNFSWSDKKYEKFVSSVEIPSFVNLFNLSTALFFSISKFSRSLNLLSKSLLRSFIFFLIFLFTFVSSFFLRVSLMSDSLLASNINISSFTSVISFLNFSIISLKFEISFSLVFSWRFKSSSISSSKLLVLFIKLSWKFIYADSTFCGKRLVIACCFS